MATDNFWGKFRRWRRHRPFWGGLFLLLSALELFASANMSLGGIEIHLGPQGFLSYLLPAILLICALLTWTTPAQRLFYGIVGLLTALYSFIGLNLGGFFFGMLFGIIGGALIIAWGPPRKRPGTPLAGPPSGEPTDHHEDQPVDVGDDIFGNRDGGHGGDRDDIEKTQQIEVAGHDDRPHEQQPIRPAGQHPAEAPGEEPPRAAGLQRLGRNRKALVLALLPVAATATIIAAGSMLPASADEECPEGLPSVTATTTAATAAKAAAAAQKAATAKKTTAAAKKTTTAAKKTTAAAKAATSTTASPSATATAEDSDGNPILEGIENFVDGVGNLLGISDEESSSPSASPSPSESASESASPSPSASETSSPSPSASASESASASSSPSASATSSAAASPSASDDVIPCLGPRQFGLTANPDDVPLVSAKPGLMEVGSLTMYDSTYDGVVDLPTSGGGTIKALKFSMNKAENKPFSLTVDEAGDAQTVITSASLTTTGRVKFYTPKFQGKLFGLFPVTFTPEEPPPLTLPILWFTDVEIQLAFVRCDTLTGDPLRVQETS